MDKSLTSGLMEKIMDSLECSVCSDLMHVPVISSCGHSFCYDCSSSWFENKVTCPTCRHELVTQPILNVLLRDISENIVNLILDQGQEQFTDEELMELKQRRDDCLRNYQYDLKNKKLFGDAFKSVLTMVDRSDGVARCANCHWEAHGSECLHCGAIFRMQRDDDSFYESMDDIEDQEERRLYDLDDDDTYDSDDSFIDGRDNEQINLDVTSDNDIFSDVDGGNESDRSYRRHARQRNNNVNEVESWRGFHSSSEGSRHSDFLENDGELRDAVRLFAENPINLDYESQDENDDDHQDENEDDIDFERTSRSMDRRRPIIIDSDNE